MSDQRERSRSPRGPAAAGFAVPVDTTGDGKADSLAIDSNKDGKIDTFIKIGDGPPPTPAFLRPPESPFDTEESVPSRLGHGIPPATPFFPPPTPGSPRPPPGSPRPGATPPPATPPPLSPATEKELEALSTNIGEARARATQLLARGLVVHVITAADDLRSRRRELLRERDAAKKRAEAPEESRAVELDSVRVLAMDDEEDDAAPSPESQRQRTKEEEEARQAEKTAREAAQDIALMDELDGEVGGLATPAQLGVSGCGKEVMWLAKNGRTDSVKAHALALASKWKQNVAVSPPVTVAVLASELEAAVQSAESTHRGYLARVRELSSWIRHAPGELRRSLLSREDRPEEVAKWEQEAFWSPEKRAQAEAAAEEAARRTTFAAVDELRPSLSENIT